MKSLRGPLILAVTVLVAAGVFLIVHSSTDDVSGAKAGTAAMIVIGVGVAILVLGLHGSERSDVVFVPRLAGEGMQSKIVGPTVLRGERHGRSVAVTLHDGRTETRVEGALAPFKLEGFRQRVRADGEVPPEVGLVLEQLGASTRWTGMKLEAGRDGIVVRRRSGSEQHWLYDLWLAERLIDDHLSTSID